MGLTPDQAAQYDNVDDAFRSAGWRAVRWIMLLPLTFAAGALAFLLVYLPALEMDMPPEPVFFFGRFLQAFAFVLVGTIIAPTDKGRSLQTLALILIAFGIAGLVIGGILQFPYVTAGGLGMILGAGIPLWVLRDGDMISRFCFSIKSALAGRTGPASSSPEIIDRGRTPEYLDLWAELEGIPGEQNGDREGAVPPTSPASSPRIARPPAAQTSVRTQSVASTPQLRPEQRATRPGHAAAKRSAPTAARNSSTTGAPPATAYRCKACGAETMSPANSACFCLSCGARIGVECAQCHRVSPVGAKFCMYCAAEMKNAHPKNAESPMMLSSLRRGKKPVFEKFLEPFNAVCELLLSLSTDEEGNPRPFDPTDMSTSASAVVGATYVTRNTSVLAGRIDETEMGPYLDEVNSLFQFVAGASIREIERIEGRKIDPTSDEGWQLVRDLCHVQEEKMSRYICALGKIVMKGPGISVGADLAIEVQRDVFGEEIPDVIFSVSLLNLVSQIT